MKLILTEIKTPKRKKQRLSGYSFLSWLDQNLAYKLSRASPGTLHIAPVILSLQIFCLWTLSYGIPLCLIWETTEAQPVDVRELTHRSSFLEVVSSVWSCTESTWPPVPVWTTKNKSTLSPAVISACLEAWNLISTFISTASLGLLQQVIKLLSPTLSTPSQCDPAVGLSDLQGTETGLAAYKVRSFVLFHFRELAYTDQGNAARKESSFLREG